MTKAISKVLINQSNLNFCLNALFLIIACFLVMEPTMAGPLANLLGNKTAQTGITWGAGAGAVFLFAKIVQGVFVDSNTQNIMFMGVGLVVLAAAAIKPDLLVQAVTFNGAI